MISGQSMTPKRDALSVSERAYGYDDDAPNPALADGRAQDLARFQCEIASGAMAASVVEPAAFGAEASSHERAKARSVPTPGTTVVPVHQ